MGTKLTQEQFVEKSQRLNRKDHTYEKAIYVDSTTPVELNCPKHANFWMPPDSIYAGCGCISCHMDRLREKAQKNLIDKSTKKFGDLIDHSKTEYNGPEEKAVLHCTIHGRFEVNPSTHLCSKHGCTECGTLASPKLRAEKKKLTFLQDNYDAHGDTYTYEKFDYKNTRTKGEITCKTHGSFWQSPQKHHAGQGCDKCAKYGYNTKRAGHFYILQADNVTKVGITHQEVRQRMWQINKSAKNLKFKIITFMFYEDGTIPRKLEDACWDYLNSKYNPTQEVFDGSTECFLDVDLNDLLAFVSPLLKDNELIATQSELEESSQPILAQ